MDEPRPEVLSEDEFGEAQYHSHAQILVKVERNLSLVTVGRFLLGGHYSGKSIAKNPAPENKSDREIIVNTKYIAGE